MNDYEASSWLSVKSSIRAMCTATELETNRSHTMMKQAYLMMMCFNNWTHLVQSHVHGDEAHEQRWASSWLIVNAIH
jgi:hypothetical protein